MDPDVHPRRGGSDESNDYCLVFVHIPKTAGTTLASSLQWNYAPRATLHVDLLGKMEELAEQPVNRRTALRLLHGHIPYGVHEHIPKPCRYLTVMREPVARAISAYKFILSSKHHELHDHLVAQKVGLEEFIETYWVDNRISRQTRQLVNRSRGPLHREHLDQAKRNLEEFVVVGLTERFEETFALVRRAVNLRLPFYVSRNVTRPLDISPHVAELIRGKDAYDVELYQFARHLFARQVAREGSWLRWEAAIYRAMRPLSRAAGKGRTEELLRKLSHARTTWSR